MDYRLCILCRGARRLCGRVYCPILARARTLIRLRPLEALPRELQAPSPPAVFVGRIGYPRILVGPGVSMHEEVDVVDLPELWPRESIDAVLEYRMSLVYGRKRGGVSSIDDPFVLELHDLVLSSRPRDVELKFEKPPRPRISLDPVAPPMGPRGVVEKFRVLGSGSPWRVVEELYSDYDVSASEAVWELYRAGIPVSYIEKLLSVGALGRKTSRKLVPTRWAITAVDSTVSEHLLSKVKTFPELGETQVFVRKVPGNTFVAILIPGKWSFEWMEAWFPGSTWNPRGPSVVVEGDWEFFGGRTEYPSIGGCYYACRLAVAEYLVRIRRQATVVVLREIYEGFDIPIGVWFVRENVREMLRSKPLRISDLREIVKILNAYTRLGASTWIKSSRVLSNFFKCRKLDHYVKMG